MEVTINDEDLQSLEGQVVVITGGSSGIGLATAILLLSLNASVIIGDLTPPPTTHPNLTYHKTNVTSWPSLLSLFTTTITLHTHINHVFANAGIAGRTDYTSASYSPSGDLLEPSHLTLDINLRGMINTAYLGIHFIQQNPEGVGGSIVCTASASSFQRFSAADYTTAKHGVLGFVRGMMGNLKGTGLRINAVSPSWTLTGLVPREICEAAGAVVQEAGVVARSVVVLMAGEKWRGSLLYSKGGRFWEIEEKLLGVGMEVVGGEGQDEETVFQRMKELMPGFGSK